MTVRYSGLNRTTGASLTDTAHIRQSISDILRTPIGSRVMRRDYGSQLFEMIDQPQTPALALQIQAACYMALLKWEPRISVSAVTVERQFDGKMIVNLTGQLASTGESLSLTLPVS
ncbi:GPW/gp25 family protein [Kosakonia oryzendophytica]|uniref:GPW/gp25 family protein n=1 Tax=Kosakonia TaxID=1330547 RepID=UPI0021D8B804|nr:GPW/gp25 family protein [Kosakonia sp. ML.JS2a]UXY12115.1 GPW/gp25 family protein [Kosakonia sp. ML.JS2a]